MTNKKYLVCLTGYEESVYDHLDNYEMRVDSSCAKCPDRLKCARAILKLLKIKKEEL